jgi:hypothetical protein
MEMGEWVEHLEDLNFEGLKRNERTIGRKLRKERELNEGMNNQKNKRMKELINIQAFVWILSHVCL